MSALPAAPTSVADANAVTAVIIETQIDNEALAQVSTGDEVRAWQVGAPAITNCTLPKPLFSPACS